MTMPLPHDGTIDDDKYKRISEKKSCHTKLSLKPMKALYYDQMTMKVHDQWERDRKISGRVRIPHSS